MAHNNIEVEIKVPVDSATFARIRGELRKIAKFDKKSQQTDVYFTPIHRDFTEPEFPFEWLSVRKRAGKTIINYKHFYPENAETTTHCKEFETELKDAGQIMNIFRALNVRELVTVEKERETYIVKDEFEIALDSVKDLGNFMEIESLKDFGGVEETRKRIIEFAKGLGINASEADKRGYPFLLMKKKGLIK